MQNSAKWIKTEADGYIVRVQFLPINPAEHAKMQAILQNPDIQFVMATTNGPLSVDLKISLRKSVGEKIEEALSPDPPPVVVPVEPVVANPPFGPPPVVVAPVPAVTTSTGTTQLTEEQLEALTKPNPTDKPA